ncbi:MAG TPA: DUF6249 domain-containing protein [Oligoflexus sp.]|uniref:DUF6249 domain-containing protein n=1 Tax=Oligoflexus sp. TaxID=1971216 RepID=UPI002D7FCAF6|nr:DUF6249 domain-containing protein [Oligoflexus sp.]HET9237210.1 DUF6249 domain-containing protein [Oligoflexus sp.]
MKRPFRTLRLILMTFGLSLYFMGTPGSAAPIEERQGVITEPAPGDTQAAKDVVLLGTTPLPPEVLNKLEPHQIVEILERQAATPKSTAQIIFNESFLIPGIVFGSMTIVSFFMLYFSYRKRRDMLDTVRAAIQSGQTLPASFLDALDNKSKPSPDSDLRKAVLLIALGLSGMTVLATLTDQQAGRAWAIGLVPTLLGVGYLFLWKQSQKRQKAGSHDEPR